MVGPWQTHRKKPREVDIGVTWTETMRLDRDWFGRTWTAITDYFGCTDFFRCFFLKKKCVFTFLICQTNRSVPKQKIEIHFCGVNGSWLPHFNTHLATVHKPFRLMCIHKIFYLHLHLHLLYSCIIMIWWSCMYHHIRLSVSLKSDHR